MYNPSVGHSQCSECGLRKVPFSKNLIDHKGDIVEKEYKNTPKNQKQNKGRQNQIQSSLPRLLNKKVRCTLSNSEVLEGVLIDISQYEIILTIDNEEIMILKHALMTIKEVKDDSTQEIL